MTEEEARVQLKCKYCDFTTNRFAKRKKDGEYKEIGYEALKIHCQYQHPEVYKKIRKGAKSGSKLFKRIKYPEYDRNTTKEIV